MTAEAGVPTETIFLDEIEELMLRGKTRTAIASWAYEAHGLEIKQVELLVDLIRGVWAGERDPGRLATRRDQIRMQYSYVYAKAMETGRLDTALKALDSLAKVDGAIQPDINITVGTNTITSRVRERVSELLGRVQALSSKPLPIINVTSGLGAVERRLEAAEFEQAPISKMKNGNGHTKKNGLAPHPDNPPEDE